MVVVKTGTSILLGHPKMIPGMWKNKTKQKQQHNTTQNKTKQNKNNKKKKKKKQNKTKQNKQQK